MRKSPLQTLKLVIDFAQMDAEQIKHASVQRRVQVLSRPQKTSPWSNPTPGKFLAVDEPVSVETLRALQAETLAFLKSPGRAPFDVELRLRAASWSPSPSARHGAPGGITIEGCTARDRFLYRVMRLFEAHGISRLRTCPACGRLFLKVTRKQFCSTQCQSRVYMRAYRAKPAETKGRHRARKN